MTNVEPAYQLIECDQDTAIQHLAMAQIMDEENADQEGVRIPAEQDNVMQLNLASGETYENKDQLFLFNKWLRLLSQFF